MFVRFVLSTVVETFQLVLAPPSAAPKSAGKCSGQPSMEGPADLLSWLAGTLLVL